MGWSGGSQVSVRWESLPPGRYESAAVSGEHPGASGGPSSMPKSPPPSLAGPIGSKRSRSAVIVSGRAPRIAPGVLDTERARQVATVADAVRAKGSGPGATTAQRLLIAAGDVPTRVAAAEELARQMDRPLERVDLGAITSAFIGETEKALEPLFREAAERGAILYFDESEALYGRRTEVRDAHDRYAALDPVWLQDQLARYPGPVVIGLAGGGGGATTAADFSVHELNELPAIAALGAPPLRRDLRLVRAVLIAAEVGHPLTIPTPIKAAYPAAMIDLHVALLIEAGLLLGSVYRSGDGILRATAERLTWAGHDALALMLNPTRWAQAQGSVLDHAGRAQFAQLIEFLRGT